MPAMRLPPSWSKSITDPTSSGGPDQLPNAGDFAGMGEITLLSQAKQLENLLNFVEDLKGTPFQDAAEFMAEKTPHTVGHVGQVGANAVRPGWLGRFVTNASQHRIGPVKGLPIGDIDLNSELANKALGSEPIRTVAHELTHVAQGLKEGAPAFDARYEDEANKFLGNFRNPYERSAEAVGKHKKVQFKDWLRARGSAK